MSDHDAHSDAEEEVIKAVQVDTSKLHALSPEVIAKQVRKFRISQRRI